MTKPTAFSLPMLITAAASALLCSATSAATVYRCGPQGNVYSDLPCAEGRTLDVADARSEEQRAQAIRVASLDRRFAADMERERLMLAAVRPAAAGNLGPRPVPVVIVAVTPARSPKRHATRKPVAAADFIAIAPAKAAR